MKTNLTKIFTTFVVAAILAVGVSYVSAYSPSTPVPGIFTTKNDDQTKQGGIMSEKFMASDLGFFTKLLAPGSTSWLNIGGPFTGNDPQGISTTGGTSPLTIHLNGAKRPTETKSGVSGITGTKFIADAGACAAPITWVNDRASSFDFVSTSNPGGYADLIAGQVRLNGGTPQDGSVLAAIDDQGNAVWAKLEIRNGAVVVVENQTGSPVSTDATCTVPPNTTYAWSTGEWGACQIPTAGSGTSSGTCDPATNANCTCSTVDGSTICIDFSNIGTFDIGTFDIGPITIGGSSGPGSPVPARETYTMSQWNSTNMPVFSSSWSNTQNNTFMSNWLYGTTNGYTRIPTDGSFTFKGSTTAGVQYAVVTCKNTTTGAVVADSFCTGTKPANSKSCIVGSTEDITKRFEFRAIQTITKKRPDGSIISNQTSTLNNAITYDGGGSCIMEDINDKSFQLNILVPGAWGSYYISYVPTTYCNSSYYDYCPSVPTGGVGAGSSNVPVPNCNGQLLGITEIKAITQYRLKP